MNIFAIFATDVNSKINDIYHFLTINVTFVCGLTDTNVPEVITDPSHTSLILNAQQNIGRTNINLKNGVWSANRPSFLVDVL